MRSALCCLLLPSCLPSQERRRMIEQTLRQTFGYDGFRAGQEQAIRAVVAGRSAAAICKG